MVINESARFWMFMSLIFMKLSAYLLWAIWAR